MTQLQQKSSYIKINLDWQIDIEMSLVNGGSFLIDESIIKLDDFYMSKYTVTQGLWKLIMGINPSHFKDCGINNPVENVSWYDAQIFITKLNNQTNEIFRLPTEAEWKYACKSGDKNEIYSGGEDIDSIAWYRANSGDMTHKVGTKSSNSLGINDMSGNVWEWTEDKWDASDNERIVLGGSWFNNPVYMRCDYRRHYRADYRNLDIGFRIVKTI